TDYRQRRLDEKAEAEKNGKLADAAATADEAAAAAEAQPERRGKRREYLREYMRWLWPHRYAVAAVFLIALCVAALEMIEPLFMRFMIDRVLLNDQLDLAARLPRLHVAGAVFLGVIVVSKLFSLLNDYRPPILHVRVLL